MQEAASTEAAFCFWVRTETCWLDITPGMESYDLAYLLNCKFNDVRSGIANAAQRGVFLKATCGVEAIKICRENPDIDLVLMDINMTKMDGYEATRQIREFNKDVVIIAQTADALAGDREKSIKAGCSKYLSKPINRGALRKILNNYFS